MFPTVCFITLLALLVCADAAPFEKDVPSSVERWRRETADETNDSVARVKRSPEEDEYEYYYYDENDTDESLLYKLKHQYRVYVIAGLVGFNVLLCCCCTCCMILIQAIKEACGSLAKTFKKCWDQLLRRDEYYREVCDVSNRMGIEPPTYKQYQELKIAFGAPEECV